MNNPNYKLISVLGWEDRFILGFERTILLYSISKLVLFKYKEYENYTKINLTKLNEISETINMRKNTYTIFYENSVKSWEIIQNAVFKEVEDYDNILLDITTMPRDSIWTLLFFLKLKKCNIKYLYYTPTFYSKGSLCKEPETPRLLYKHSGIIEFNKPTALVVVTGFDPERTSQLINFYDPQVTLLGIQIGDQFDNESRNKLESHLRNCKGETKVKTFSIDAYSYENAYSSIKNNVVKLLKKYNIIVSSLGPKPSAVAIYKVYQDVPNIALCYVPTKEYNLDYSHGLKNSIVVDY